ncbi:MAG TPA: methyltransferase [Stellaceae bacterium]|nr:methyltransferase [Stellaceae bacterium]
MANAPEQVIDLIFGRWRSQILYAGTALGVFDHMAKGQATSATALAPQVGADPTLLYRLLRALAAIGLLAEDDRRGFRLTEAGALLREDHPRSLRAMALLEEGPEHYAVWKHLLPVLRDGRQDGFVREFGMRLFDYARTNPAYGAVFNQAMSSYSTVTTQWALAALVAEDFSRIHTLCDVGGGHGHLACGLLGAYPHLAVTVLDLPEVVGEIDRLWAPRLGLSGRCRYLGGDMFAEVPKADAYTLKAILHDWSDAECTRILANLRRSVIGRGRVFVAEFVVPGPDEPHFSKLFDIHMMCALPGRERTAGEYAELLAAAGWHYDTTHRVPDAFHSLVAATAA